MPKVSSGRRELFHGRRQAAASAQRRRASAPGRPRRGRPRKAKDGAPDTRTRLINAASDAFVAHGFEATTMEEIASRCGVTTTAIYNHFKCKDDLMLLSARLALENALSQLQACVSASSGQGRVPYVRAYMSPKFARTRQLLGEIHVAAMRHPRLRDMLKEWHRERAGVAVDPTGGPSAIGVKAFFMILLGICHLDSLNGIKAPSSGLIAAMEAAALAALGV